MFFRMTSMKPCECQGTLRFKKKPGYFGNYKDADGKIWNFNGFMNGCYLVAPADTLSPYWGSTATN